MNASGVFKHAKRRVFTSFFTMLILAPAVTAMYSGMTLISEVPSGKGRPWYSIALEGDAHIASLQECCFDIATSGDRFEDLDDGFILGFMPLDFFSTPSCALLSLLHLITCVSELLKCGTT